ncbi:hypothetical protein [Streptomyces luteireticuli]|uniref:hypothetical protein n=1 Tax=Streptomyces luteireticuli TaxID=173858 RepID=UPI003557A545
MHDDDHEIPPATGPGPDPRPGQAPPVPSSAAEWREALRKEQLPEDLAQLPRRKRRKAARAWRSARRDARAQWIKNERKNTPTPLTVPLLALVIAGAVLGAAWLWPEHSSDRTTATPRATPTTSADEHEPDTPPVPVAPGSPAPALTNPDDVAKGFATGYSTRLPLQDGSHTAAVQRAAPYASAPLTANLRRHDDRDFNKLVAAQAREAKPSKVVITEPAGRDQRPAPDTPIRVWRLATVTVDVKGTDNYTYERRLTLEVSRADTGAPWMVTRVLGIEE